jgi:hypothetical protein
MRGRNDRTRIAECRLMRGVRHVEGMRALYLFRAWRWHVAGAARVARLTALVDAAANGATAAWVQMLFRVWRAKTRVEEVRAAAAAEAAAEVAAEVAAAAVAAKVAGRILSAAALAAWCDAVAAARQCAVAAEVIRCRHNARARVVSLFCAFQALVATAREGRYDRGLAKLGADWNAMRLRCEARGVLVAWRAQVSRSRAGAGCGTEDGTKNRAEAVEVEATAEVNKGVSGDRGTLAQAFDAVASVDTELDESVAAVAAAATITAASAAASTTAAATGAYNAPAPVAVWSAEVMTVASAAPAPAPAPAPARAKVRPHFGVSDSSSSRSFSFASYAASIPAAPRGFTAVHSPSRRPRSDHDRSCGDDSTHGGYRDSIGGAHREHEPPYNVHKSR